MISFLWFSLAEPKVLVKGNDFYMFPRLSPNGQHLAWMEWSHPNLPWDQTSIWVGEVSSSGYVCLFCPTLGNLFMAEQNVQAIEVLVKNLDPYIG